jgi:NADH:ubiquinone oxidoreductase subunit 2 (subunit N)
MPKIILFSILTKLYFFTCFDHFELWSPFFLLASIASIAVGSFSAIYQKRVKRLFAYSTISHTGFILLGLLVGTPESVKALTFYIIVYAFLTILLFSLLIYSSISSNNSIKYIANWTSVGFKNYFFTACFTLTLFSIAGIPPLAGFFSKFFVLLSIVGNEYYISSIVIILLSGISCFFYIRFIKIFFFTKTSKYSFWLSNSTKQNTEIIISLFLLFNICFFIFPNTLTNLSTIIGFALV